MSEQPVTATTPTSSGYIPSLDGMRAIAVLLVFFSHAHFTKLIPGGFGVTIFFFLSGYLITTLLAREYDREGRIAFGAFYLRRLLRLSPPLLITLAIAIGLHFAGVLKGVVDPSVVLSQIFYYYNYFSLYGGPAPYMGGLDGALVGANASHTIPGLGLLWSLSVEEHFYLIWPLVFVAIARKFMGIPHMMGLIVLILIWRAIRVFAFGDPEWVIHISTDTRIDMLLFGCLLALMNWRDASSRIFPQGGAKYAVIALAVALILMTLVIREEAFRLTLRYTLQGIAMMPLFYYAVAHHNSPIFKPLNWAPARIIGQYSYTIYLGHYVIMSGIVGNGIAADGSLMLVILSAVLTFIYAAAMHRWVEQPSHILRKRISSVSAERAARS